MTTTARNGGPSSGGPSRWRIYRIERTDKGHSRRRDLGEIEAANSKAALTAYATKEGLTANNIGKATMAVVGVGLIRVEEIRPVATSLPPVETMREALVKLGHPGIDVAEPDAVELRYRQAILRERKETRQ